MKQVKFKLGDRVTSLIDGGKGTVVRLGKDERAVQVRWEGGTLQITDVSALEKVTK